MGILFPSLFSLVFVGIGGLILAYAYRMAAKARASQSWPATEGEIAHSAVLARTSRSTETGTATYYSADVTYRYKVAGKDYSSSRIALIDVGSTTGRAQAIVQRYPDQAKVRVYYNPSDPSEAFLEPGLAAGVQVLYLAGGAFTLGGLFLLFMSLTGHVRMAT
jgi:hypothetical protein